MSELSLIKMTKAEAVDGHSLHLRFSDGSEGVRDFTDILAGDGEMLRPLRDPAYFARVFLDFGTPTWPNGYDLAPHALHAEMQAAHLLRRRASA